MLKRLRGRAHLVTTAVAVARAKDPGAEPDLWQRTNTAEVWMRRYDDDEIDDYVATGDPLDKAGSYAIQHSGFHPVERLEGCFLTVVGLPLPDVLDLLSQAAWPLPEVDRETVEAVCPGCRDLSRLPFR